MLNTNNSETLKKKGSLKKLWLCDHMGHGCSHMSHMAYLGGGRGTLAGPLSTQQVSRVQPQTGQQTPTHMLATLGLHQTGESLARKGTCIFEGAGMVSSIPVRTGDGVGRVRTHPFMCLSILCTAKIACSAGAGCVNAPAPSTPSAAGRWPLWVWSLYLLFIQYQVYLILC